MAAKLRKKERSPLIKNVFRRQFILIKNKTELLFCKINITTVTTSDRILLK